MEQGSYDDRLGAGYAGRRKADPRIESAIVAALADARSVVNVGAGTGSYEPTDRPMLAVEPSSAMIRQRSAGAAPCVADDSSLVRLATRPARTPACRATTDCPGHFDNDRDGFLGAYWRRPEVYLDPVARQSMSSFAKIDAERGLRQLASDLDAGVWRERNAALLDLDALDLGYRLLVWELDR